MNGRQIVALWAAAVWAAGATAADMPDEARWAAQPGGADEPSVVLKAPPSQADMTVELWLGVRPWGCASPLLSVHNTGATSIVTGGAYEQGDGFALGRLSVDRQPAVMLGFKVSPREGGELALGSVASGTAGRTGTSLQTLESLAAGQQARLEFVDIETGMPIGEVAFELRGLRTAWRIGRQMCAQSSARAGASPELGSSL